MGLFDAVTALWSPKAAARREMSKVSALVAREVKRELLMRGYDAGRATRQTWAWLAGSTSANAEVYMALINLRNRSRDLVRNNPHATKALRVLTNNAVGTGVMATARTSNKRLNAKIDKLWSQYIRECDFGGQFDLYGLQRLAVRSMLEGGETVIRFRTEQTPCGVPLQLQLLEGDYIDHRKNERGDNGNPIHQGVEFDSRGKRSALWLFQAHPGDRPFIIPETFVSDRIPSDDVVHLYEAQRIGQIRGIPWFTSGIMKARELDTYEEAELVRKRIEACVAAIVMGADDESQEGIAPQVVDSAGNKVEQFEPGLIAIARGTKDIKFTQPAASGGYSEYKRTQLQSLAASWDLTYELLTGDLSRVNFSSIKAGINEFRRSIEVLQWIVLIPMMMDPIYRRFIDRAIAAGKLPAGTGYDVEWTTPKFEAVDPVKEVEGDIAAVRGFLMTPQEAIRRRGFDPDVVLEEHRVWHEALEAAGVVSDADATQVSKAGSAPPAKEPEKGEAGAGASADS
jgi:lambda family phage portal protein